MPATTQPDLCPAHVRQLSRDLVTEIAELPRLSCVVEQFLLHVGRDTATAADIAAALELDPILRAWVLRQANSGFCKLNRPIWTVAEACVVLGIGPVTRLVYAACTRDLLRRRLCCYQYPGNGFWLHGLAVGLASRRLAALLGEDSPLGIEAGQVAGLLHDVGKLLLDARLAKAGSPRLVSLAEERQCAGLDHGFFSAAVADTWSLPQDVVLALACHHAEEPPAQARLVATADLLIGHWGVGAAVYPRLDREPPLKALFDQAAQLGADRTMVERWCRELQPLLSGLTEMLNTIGHGRPPVFPSEQDHRILPKGLQKTEGAVRNHRRFTNRKLSRSESRRTRRRKD